MGKKVKNRIYIYAEMCLAVLLVCQIVTLGYLNLCRIPKMLDTDAANEFYHMVQIIRNGTVDIPNWVHTTTMELDSSMIFAIPVYLVTQNVFLSFGLSNIIIMLLYLGVITSIFYYSKTNKIISCIVLLALFNPWKFGMLDYTNMLFFGASQYSIKVLIPLLGVLYIMLDYKKNNINCKDKVIKYGSLILYLCFLFLTTFSTGVYVLVCGIVPIIITIILDIWKKGNIDKKYIISKIIFMVLSFLDFAIGYVCYKKVYPCPSKYQMELTKMENYESMIRSCFRGIFQVFGATSNDAIKGLSTEGIFLICKIMFVCILLLVAVKESLSLLEIKEEKWENRAFQVLFLFNFVLLILYDSRFSPLDNLEYRYLLIGLIPLLILLGLHVSDWIEHINKLQKNTILGFFFLLVVICTIGNNKKIYEERNKSEYAVEIVDYMKTIGVDSIIYMNDRDIMNLSRALDVEHKYGAFNQNEGNMFITICSYEKEREPEYYGNNFALAVVKDTNLTDYLPEDVISNYTYVGRVRWLDVYVCSQATFRWW